MCSNWRGFRRVNQRGIGCRPIRSQSGVRSEKPRLVGHPDKAYSVRGLDLNDLVTVLGSARWSSQCVEARSDSIVPLQDLVDLSTSDHAQSGVRRTHLQWTSGKAFPIPGEGALFKAGTHKAVGSGIVINMLAQSFRASKTFTTFVVCVSIFTDILLQNLIVPVLPYALSERVGLSNKDDVQRWNSILLASYGGSLMVGSCMLIAPRASFASEGELRNPMTWSSWRHTSARRQSLTWENTVFFGWIGDRIPGRRTPFILGVAVLGASTLCFALGSTLPVLLIARILEGLSTAIVCTLGYALLNDAVGTEHIGKAMGYTSVALSLGLFSGPVIGGVLYEYGGYFQVFLPAFGLIAVEIILRAMIIEPKKRSPGTTSGGRGGAGTEASAEIVADECLPSANGTEEQPLLPGKVHKSTRHAFSILLCSPRFLVAVTSLFVLNTIGCGFDGVLVPYINDAFGLNPMHAAALFLAIALPMFLAPISGALTDRFGAKWPAACGFLIAIPSLILLRLVARGTKLPFLKLAILLFFVGLAFALAMPPLRVEVSKVVEVMERESPGIFGPYGAFSQAYGLMNTAIAAGGLAGPLYAGFVRVWLGWGAMSLSMGILSSIMLLFVVIFTGRKTSLSSKAIVKPAEV